MEIGRYGGDILRSKVADHSTLDLMAGVPDTSSNDHKAPEVVVTFTEEEERELAELLNDD